MLNNNRGVLFVISAPSGAGKTTIIHSVLKDIPELLYSISATTRKKRGDEVDGKDYFFLDEPTFHQKIEKNAFAEWQKVYDYYYGTYKSFLDENLNKGRSIILDLDVKGALNLKQNYPEAVLVFIEPPGIDELERRLKKRKTENEHDLNLRIERAKMELSHKDKFDYFVVNKNLDIAIENLKSIIVKVINKEVEP
ncbi:MAG TPA: guanylate kinase [Ignavibacteriaceae bacterium]|jgi:guanylate kinase|nr:guanylate kinase [Ignavibacteriaceae bacterium]